MGYHVYFYYAELTQEYLDNLICGIEPTQDFVVYKNEQLSLIVPEERIKILNLLNDWQIC